MTKISSLDESPEMKECRNCQILFERNSFRKRKNRNGEMSWVSAYCRKCECKKVVKSRNIHIEKYRIYHKKQSNDYYHENKDKVRIVQKRYYYNKLPPEKQVKYKQKVENTWPEWVEQICGK